MRCTGRRRWPLEDYDDDVLPGVLASEPRGRPPPPCWACGARPAGADAAVSSSCSCRQPLPSAASTAATERVRLLASGRVTAPVAVRLDRWLDDGNAVVRGDAEALRSRVARAMGKHLYMADASNGLALTVELVAPSFRRTYGRSQQSYDRVHRSVVDAAQRSNWHIGDDTISLRLPAVPTMPGGCHIVIFRARGLGAAGADRIWQVIGRALLGSQRRRKHHRRRHQPHNKKRRHGQRQELVAVCGCEDPSRCARSSSACPSASSSSSSTRSSRS